MKKRRATPTTYTASRVAKKQPEEKDKGTPIDDDDEDTGFSQWLKTGPGVEFMKYFVMVNSLGVFLTLGWPSISKSFQVIRSYFFEDEDY